jgi:hypothetical protein
VVPQQPATTTSRQTARPSSPASRARLRRHAGGGQHRAHRARHECEPRVRCCGCAPRRERTVRAGAGGGRRRTGVVPPRWPATRRQAPSDAARTPWGTAPPPICCRRRARYAPGSAVKTRGCLLFCAATCSSAADARACRSLFSDFQASLQSLMLSLKLQSDLPPGAPRAAACARRALVTHHFCAVLCSVLLHPVARSLQRT